MRPLRARVKGFGPFVKGVQAPQRAPETRPTVPVKT